MYKSGHFPTIFSQLFVSERAHTIRIRTHGRLPFQTLSYARFLPLCNCASRTIDWTGRASPTPLVLGQAYIWRSAVLNNAAIGTAIETGVVHITHCRKGYILTGAEHFASVQHAPSSPHVRTEEARGRSAGGCREEWTYEYKDAQLHQA